MTCEATVVFQLSTGRRALPVKQAKVTVTDSYKKTEVTEYTGEEGKTKPIHTETPSKELAMSPFAATKPYSIYHAYVEAEGYFPITIHGLQMFEGTVSIVELNMTPLPINKGVRKERYEVEEHSLRCARERKKDMKNNRINLRVHSYNCLAYVHIPAVITVHLGEPDDHSAKNLTVSFLDYIKNVACSELYLTWPLEALEANIYVQVTLALHRLYTGWYSSKGYDFDITNQAAYDQTYVAGRNIYENISQIVDRQFDFYIREKESCVPLFPEYGNTSLKENKGLSKWGSVSLAQQGYSPIEILKVYYGDQIEIAQTNIVEEMASPYPGFILEQGSISPSVETLERSINRIHRNYPAIPMIIEMDYRFTSETQWAVSEFQKMFFLEETGKADAGTWNRIAFMASAILRLQDLNQEGQMQPIPSIPPSVLLRLGSRGGYVRLAQYFIKVIACFYEDIRMVDIDGVFGKRTRAAVLDVQKRFELSPDAIIGPLTWDQLYNGYLGIAISIGIVIPYPGYLVRRGTRGENVYLMQEYLKTISKRLNVPDIDIDGIFGPGMEASVMAFQELFGLDPDGLIGKQTWERIVSIRRLI